MASIVDNILIVFSLKQRNNRLYRKDNVLSVFGVIYATYCLVDNKYMSDKQTIMMLVWVNILPDVETHRTSRMRSTVTAGIISCL